MVTVSFIFEEVFAGRVRSKNVWATCLENTGDGCVNFLGAFVLVKGSLDRSYISISSRIVPPRYLMIESKYSL